jgi:hypothetical protein
MKLRAPHHFAGLFLLGHSVLTVMAWGLFIFITSAIDDQPLSRLLRQFSSPDHPIFSLPSQIFVGVSLLLAMGFFSPLAKQQTGAFALTVLVALHALCNLVFVGVSPFVYLSVVCLIAYRGYQRASPTVC